MVSGRNTWHLIPASLQYAAAEIPAFPAEGRHISSTPCAFASVTAKDIPLSLNEPVGFTVSFLTYKSGANCWSGVYPSPRLIILFTLGRTDLYLHNVF